MASYSFRPRSFAPFERSKACSAKIQKLGLSPSDSLNFHASLHQERFAKWSKRDSFGSHQSLLATRVEHCSEEHHRMIWIKRDALFGFPPSSQKILRFQIRKNLEAFLRVLRARLPQRTAPEPQWQPPRAPDRDTLQRSLSHPRKVPQRP